MTFEQILDSLIKEYFKIKNMGFIETKRKGTTGIGYTLECLLNKKEDQYPTPDYFGIEVKSRLGYSKSNLVLFHLTPNSEKENHLKNLYKKFGWISKKTNMRLLTLDANCQNYTEFSYKYKSKISIDYKKEIIILKIYNKYNNEIIDENLTWSFKEIKERIYLKLKWLAIFTGYDYKINNKTYYKYTNMEVYKFINFYQFLHILESGKIHIMVNIGTKITNNNIHEMDDHGTAFTISKNDIQSIFDLIWK